MIARNSMTITPVKTPLNPSSLDGKLFSDNEVIEMYELRIKFEGIYNSLINILVNKNSLHQIRHNPEAFLSQLRGYVEKCDHYRETRLLQDAYRKMNNLLRRAESLLLGKLGTYKKQNGE